MPTPGINTNSARPVAIQARAAFPMLGEKPARGQHLFLPLEIIDNCLLVIRNGYIEGIGAKKNTRLPAGCAIIDYGDCILAPALVNAHTHLQLSWLDASPFWGGGFARWLKGMIPRLLAINPDRPDAHGIAKMRAALSRARARLLASGCGYVGDVGGSIRGALTEVIKYSHSDNLRIAHFCEWFGFLAAGDIWPARCAREAREAGRENCAPAAHGLYSTSAEIMQMAHNWCMAHNKAFSFHLAESDEEVEMLLGGSGALHDLYKENVLPPDWKPPRKTPLAYAQSLGILGKGTLAVHGVKLAPAEIAQLGASGCALCLCPRSNANLGVGEAPARQLMDKGVLLCLGTDGLTSNTDLDVRKEAIFLHERFNIPHEPLLRMLTVNGATALGYGFQPLARGNPAQFALIPDSLLQSV